MSIVGRLEKSIDFLKANAWGQDKDRDADPSAPDGFRYCAQGAIAYGGFAGSGMTFCPYRTLFHEGECTAGVFDECTVPPDDVVDLEFRDVVELCNQTARDVTGVSYFGLTWYNDQSHRTKEDMIALLEKVLDRAKTGKP